MRIALVTALSLAAPLPPQAPAPGAPAPVTIFDGKSLAGWAGDRAIWSVRDGCIVGSSVGREGGPGSFLRWQGGELADFVLDFEVRLEGDNNSGVQYRSKPAGEHGEWLHGYQCDVHPQADYFGMLYEEGGRGIVARRGQRIACSNDGTARVTGELGAATAVDLRQWHRGRITARGRTLQHEFDGALACEVVDDAATALRQGVLGLQVHGGAPMTVWFRELRLQRLAGQEVAATAAPPLPKWIWDAAPQDGEEVFFRVQFALPGPAKSARLAITCDNHCRVYLNGERVLQSDRWEDPRIVDVANRVQAGDNVLAVHGWNDGTVAGLCARLDWVAGPGQQGVVVTDAGWKCSADDAEGWDRRGFDDRGWAAVRVLAALGEAGAPWSATLRADAFDVTAGDSDAPQPPAAADELQLAPGYSAQRLLRVPRGMGSWVCLCRDDRGCLYASDQARGLYRIAPAGVAGSAVSTIERVDVDLDGAQGLLWAHGALYAVANGRHSGLYRLRDSDGDDRLDHVELLRKLGGDGEHGPHAVELDRDGVHLLVLCGNHTALPELSRSRLPRNWGEDLLLPRIDDPGGHAVGVMAPGGFLCRVDPDGRQWELLTAGFRNWYDLAVDAAGEIFVFDADMEWDMGLPWYRPTRVLHCVSGADYGWRNGSGKWPVDYPDTLPSVCDVGPGSPTGMVHAGSTLYCLDWTFGTVYALAPSPRGASFGGVPVPVVTATPLPLTDAVADGEHLYLLTGGRGLPSVLYRLQLPAAAATPPVPAAAAALLRRRLEAFHGGEDPAALAAAWPALGDADPFVRHAARIAVEWQPVAQWRDRALAERGSAWSTLTALLAVARQGGPADLAALLAALAALDVARLEPAQQVAWARIHALAFVRMGLPTGELRATTAGRLLAGFPGGQLRADQERCALLCALDAPGLLDRAVPLLQQVDAPAPPPWAEVATRSTAYGGVIQRMLADMPPGPQLAYAYALRTVAHGWTLEQRETFFRFLQGAQRRAGGASYRGYLTRIWDDAMATCGAAERGALAAVVGDKLPAPAPFRATPPRGPGRDWQLDDALALARRGLHGRDFANGRNLFHATACAACHRFAGEGGSVGPDLTSLGNKFGAADVLEAILLPSKVVSDQYAGTVLTRRDGSTVFGRLQRVVSDGVDVWSGTEATAAAAPVRVAVADVAKAEPAKLSTMPAGLVNPLNDQELLDLLAYLLSRGDSGGPMFAR